MMPIMLRSGLSVPCRQWTKRTFTMRLPGQIFDSAFCTVSVSRLPATIVNLLTIVVQSLSALPGEACAAQGADILDQLRSEYGAKLPILLLSLEVACKQPAMNADTVSSQIEGIMHTAHLIEANHRVMMHYIQRLSSASTPHATRCLKNYIIQRLIPEGNIDWTENGIVSYLAMYSAQDSIDSTPTVQGLHQELDIFCNTMGCGLSPVAAQSAHVLV